MEKKFIFPIPLNRIDDVTVCVQNEFEKSENIRVGGHDHSNLITITYDNDCDN